MKLPVSIRPLLIGPFARATVVAPLNWSSIGWAKRVPWYVLHVCACAHSGCQGSHVSYIRSKFELRAPHPNAKAQNLRGGPVTTFGRLMCNPNQRLYLMRSANIPGNTNGQKDDEPVTVLAMLKVGPKKLFVMVGRCACCRVYKCNGSRVDDNDAHNSGHHGETQ